MTQTAVYAGSFDPPTHGHVDLIERAVQLFPHVIVAVGHHSQKQTLFSVSERVALLESVCARFPTVETTHFDGLLVEFARNVNARVLVRGLRAATDFEYELRIAHANADLAPELDTVFLPTRTRHGFISASLVKEIAGYGGDVSSYAPAVVVEALRKKLQAEP